MADQAATLRKMAGGKVVDLRPRRDRAIAITGGKGGVGKSTVAVNLACAYAKQGAQALTVDADLGMADLNLLLGVAPEFSLLDILRGCPIDDVLVEAHGIHLLPALNGSYSLENMDDDARAAVFGAISSLDDRFDTLIVDIAAGIGPNQVAFAGAVSDVVVVATPEPLSLADAYACLKVLATRQKLRHAFIAPNRVRSRAEAEEVVARLSSLVGRFLGMTLTPLPAVPYDPLIAEAAAAGIPLVHYRPDAPAARAIKHLARRLDTLAMPDRREGVTRLFWRNAFGDAKEGTQS